MKKLLLLLTLMFCLNVNAQLTTLMTFTGTATSICASGTSPFGSLYYDGTYLYGMTSEGGYNALNDCGAAGCGVIFKIKPNGTGCTILYNFGGYVGANPSGSLISDGTYLYGMTLNGGSTAYGSFQGYGTVFKIKPDGTGYTTLYNFTDSMSSGIHPHGSLTYDGTYLYGMTSAGDINALCNNSNGCGDIFRIKPDGTSYDTLMTFNGF